jgi:hypothetical protein
MWIVWISLLVSLFVLADLTSADGKVTKLQIGVKKRVDNCSIKSKKGDVLHMHYTVYGYICRFYTYFIGNTRGWYRIR